jgi:TonB family protein
LRSGFPRLDDFIANLEPGMWVVEPGAVTASERREQEARQLEERRSRLLALANELERGRIMHHRAFRVNQLNQLRDQAVTELRGKAEAEGPLQALPGPDANQWIAWATTLQEPDDAESLQMLRDGFERLDDFVANLEPDMWVPDGAASAPAAAIMEEPIAPQQSQPVPEPVEPPKISVAPMAVAPAPPAKSKAAKAAARAARAAARAEAAAAVATVTAVAEPTPAPVIHSFPAGPNGDVPLRSDADVPSTSPDNSDSPNSLNNMFSDHIQFKRPLNVHGDADEDESNPSFAATFKSRVEGLLRGRWQMLLVATSAVVLIALGLFLWRSHHNGEVKAAERSEPAKSTPAATTYDPSVVAAANAAQPPAGSAKSANEKDSKQKDQKDAKNQNNQKDQQKDQASEQNPSNETATKQASLLDDGGLRTPSAIPKNGAKKEEVAVNTPPPGMPGALPGAMPNGMASVVKDMPVAQPKISAQKVKVSSGVAQAMLVHQVPPEYPSQARQQGIQGTVVLQAVIGKDGSVRNVRAVSGNFLLRQAAVDAVKQWRYRPYSVDGEPVEADTQIDVKFRP